MKYDLAHACSAAINSPSSTKSTPPHRRGAHPLIISGRRRVHDKLRQDRQNHPKLIRTSTTRSTKSTAPRRSRRRFAKCERLLSLTNMSDPANIDIMHHVTRRCSAHTLNKHDVDYVVKTVKSSSLMNSRAGRCPAAAGPTVCTRPWKPRKVRSSAKTDARDHYLSELFPHVQELSA